MNLNILNQPDGCQMSPSPFTLCRYDSQAENPLKSLNLFQDPRAIVLSIAGYGTLIVLPKMENLMLYKKLKVTQSLGERKKKLCFINSTLELLKPGTISTLNKIRWGKHKNVLISSVRGSSGLQVEHFCLFSVYFFISCFSCARDEIQGFINTGQASWHRTVPSSYECPLNTVISQFSTQGMEELLSQE